MHVLITHGLRTVSRLLPSGDARVQISVVYDDDHVPARSILTAITDREWSVQESSQARGVGEGSTGLRLGLSGRHSPPELIRVLAALPGVHSVKLFTGEDDE